MNAVEESIHDNHIKMLQIVFPHLRVFISLVRGVEEWRGWGREERGKVERRGV